MKGLFGSESIFPIFPDGNLITLIIDHEDDPWFKEKRDPNYDPFKDA